MTCLKKYCDLLFSCSLFNCPSIQVETKALRSFPICDVNDGAIFVQNLNPMKKIAFLSFASLLLISCKKEKDSYSVKFVTTGNNVTQFKFHQGSTISDKAVPFSGTQDTTVAVAAGTMVKLDTKANSNNLVCAIFVDGVQVANGTDTDNDGDGKSQVKIEYMLAK